MRSRLKATSRRLHNFAASKLSLLREESRRSLQAEMNSSWLPYTRRPWLNLEDPMLRVPFKDYAWPTKSKDMKPFKHQ